MATCHKIKFKHRAICAGDLDRRIELQTRGFKNCNTSVDFGQEFTKTKSTYAALVTARGKDIFAGANMETLVSHIFYIRYFDGLTSESWINYRSTRYDILEVENLDERNEFYALFCNVRGDDSLEVNDG